MANMSQVNQTMLLDSKVFNETLTKRMLPLGAPKIMKLLEKIEQLDAKDMKTHKKHFKHMIFTDIDSATYGGKLIASALAIFGFTPAFDKSSTGTLSLKENETLLETKGKNFGLLLSKPYAKKPMNVKFKKAQMHKYNERPSNTHGDLMRFIILDQGYKEGIDLFDVKYVHLFEPLVSRADEKQAIGRGTRFCGQKGLEFHPRFGWPLYVFRYDVKLSRPMFNSRTLFELFLHFSEIDMRRVVFASELENAVINAAVDKHLTSEIHSFKVDVPPPIITPLPSPSTRSANSVEGGSLAPMPPRSIMTLATMQSYVARRFEDFKYPRVKLENMCSGDSKNAPVSSGKVTFTPTQDFIRHFFQPSSAYKGMLLFHSVGTGKTCTAIATATTSFEREGYTILWVTRHTLKSDIWKNMYGQICSTVIQEQIDSGKLKLPKDIKSPMSYMSKNWMEPISYKQFSNMLLKENRFYEEIVERNGTVDPLKKTLIIIDEAHKLYAENVTRAEKPQVDILENMIEKSYKVSGKNSCRVLLMTATPYTSDGMEMVKLLNLLREKADALPREFPDFAAKYLDQSGYFTKKGLVNFQDKVSGYVSYLNRSQDGRYFAHPIIENVYAKPTSFDDKQKANKHLDIKIKELTQQIKEKKAEMKQEMQQMKGKVKDAKSHCKEEQKAKMSECKEAVKVRHEADVVKAKETKASSEAKCKELPVAQRKSCKENAKGTYDDKMLYLKDLKSIDLDKCNDIKNQCNGPLTNTMAEIEQKKKDIDVQVDELKKLKDSIKGTIKGVLNSDNAASLSSLRAQINGHKETVLRLKTALSIANKKYRDEKDKDKKVEIKKVLIVKRAEYKKAYADMLEVRNNIKILSNSIKVARMDIGRAGIKDMSQDKAFDKCMSLESKDLDVYDDEDEEY